jgi:hypothetical protein
VSPFSEAYSNRRGEMLYLLLGAVGFVLLTECVNVAYPLPAKGTKTTKPIRCVGGELQRQIWTIQSKALKDTGIEVCLVSKGVCCGGRANQCLHSDWP